MVSVNDSYPIFLGRIVSGCLNLRIWAASESPRGSSLVNSFPRWIFFLSPKGFLVFFKSCWTKIVFFVDNVVSVSSAAHYRLLFFSEGFFRFLFFLPEPPPPLLCSAAQRPHPPTHLFPTLVDQMQQRNLCPFLVTVRILAQIILRPTNLEWERESEWASVSERVGGVREREKEKFKVARTEIGIVHNDERSKN